jgi:5-methylcytosine-specific restriction endonuclease McrA
VPAYKLCRCGGVIDERAKPLTCSKCGVKERIKPKTNSKSGDERGYGRDWDQLSRRFRANHPLCMECEKAGRFTLARDVHHIVPIEQDPTRRMDVTNLMAVCRACHQRLDREARGNPSYLSPRYHQDTA